ncbi:UNVERIFIED_CONTAM: hypothetical protein Slati_3810700 [Sesamum latifolium]|uniref:Uncharacterized protein n=1 Tax=Sesamum latifolium TaxID=2727402 RepID=A0AAW2U4S7_9LAMI
MLLKKDCVPYRDGRNIRKRLDNEIFGEIIGVISEGPTGGDSMRGSSGANAKLV